MTVLDAPPVVISDELASRAHDLLEQGRVCLVAGWEERAAVVNGLTGWYVCRAYSDRVECDCRAGSSGALCSHVLACMAVWQDRLTDAFGGAHAPDEAPW